VVSGRGTIRIIPHSQFSGPKERTKKNQVYNTWGFLHRKGLYTHSPSHIDFGPHRKNLIVLFFEKCKRTKITQTSLTFCPLKKSPYDLEGGRAGRFSERTKRCTAPLFFCPFWGQKKCRPV